MNSANRHVPQLVLQTAMINRIVATNQSTLISGARGVGKSVVLEEVAARLHTSIIRGRNVQSAISAIAASECGLILIDDLDVLFDEVHGTLAKAEAEGRRLIYTSTRPPDLTLLLATNTYPDLGLDDRWLRDWSKFTDKSMHELLDPWPWNWHGRVREMLYNVVSGDTRADQLLMSELATAVVHLSGGHPALLDPAIAEVSLMYGDDALPELAELISSWPAGRDRRRLLYSHLEDALFSSPGFRRMHRVARSLKESAPGVYAYLAERARTGEVEFDAPIEHRRLLTEQGLVSHNPRTRKFTVAGELLRRLLANTASRPGMALAGDVSSDHGSIVFTIGGRRITIDLRGSAWIIMRELHAHKNTVVPVNDLAQAAALDQSGVRSALQRLKGEFAQAGVDGVVENVWGQGYQLSEFPLIAT